jgi:hypothetical protein
MLTMLRGSPPLFVNPCGTLAGPDRDLVGEGFDRLVADPEPHLASQRDEDLRVQMHVESGPRARRGGHDEARRLDATELRSLEQDRSQAEPREKPLESSPK